MGPLDRLGSYLNQPGVSRRGLMGRAARGGAAAALALLGVGSAAQGAAACANRHVGCCNLCFNDCNGCGSSFTSCIDCSGSCWDWVCVWNGSSSLDCIECYGQGCSCAQFNGPVSPIVPAGASPAGPRPGAGR